MFDVEIQWVIYGLCLIEQALRESHLEKGLEPPRIGPFSLTRQILRDDGIPGMFRGLKPTFMREMPGYFFFFYAYELSRELMRPDGESRTLESWPAEQKRKLWELISGKSKDEIGPLRTIISGGIAGTTLWTIIFPADVIKSRQQVGWKLKAWILLPFCLSTVQIIYLLTNYLMAWEFLHK